MSSRLRLGLRGQLLLGLFVVAFLAVLSAGLLAVLVVRESYSDYEDQSVRAVARSAAQLLVAARTPARPLAEDVTRGRFGRVARELGRAGAILELSICDRDGRLILDTRRGPGAPGRGADPCRDPAVTTALAGLERLERVTVGGPGEAGGARTELRAAVPLRERGTVEGSLRLTLGVEASLEAAEARTRWLLLGLGLLDGGVILLVGALLFGRLILRPVTELERAAERIAAGAAATPVSEAGPGEVGRLAASFNRMTAALAGKVAENEARTAELAASREQLLGAAKLASVGRLAAGLAHEVGNPLGAMLGYVELLREGARPGEDPALVADVVARLHREIERIHRIMQDLLAYSRPAPEQAEAVALDDVVAAAVALMRPQARFKALTLEVAVAPGLPAVSASPGRLTQVLVNLLLNAADAVAGTGKVVVTARAAGAAVLLEVADDGPGVPAADRERIFDPFFTTKEPGQGTGLGLAISQSLCESFGATLSLVETPAGSGATFRVTLRRADD